MHPRQTTLILFACLLTCPSVLADDATDSDVGKGAQIFQQICINCHGSDGQGTDEGYEEPIFGDETIPNLALLIERTMPEDDPESCVGDEAKLVAEYIYHEFYSLAARQRKGLVELPRR